MKRDGLVHHHHQFIEMKFVLSMIELKNCTLDVKQQSLTQYIHEDVK